MSASQAPAARAVALQLALALDRYEAAVATMLETWPDLERYGVVSADVEEIRRLAATIPQLSADWVELLIAHAELVHCLWRLQYGSPGPQAKGLGELRSHHACCITALRAA
ncbi:MAG TPA: hypothetical protein VIL30_10405, partial [Ramlibacter sp.]